MAGRRNTVRLAYSIDEAAESLGRSRRWLYHQLDSGTIRGKRLGARTVNPISELERLLNEAPDATVGGERTIGLTRRMTEARVAKRAAAAKVAA